MISDVGPLARVPSFHLAKLQREVYLLSAQMMNLLDECVHHRALCLQRFFCFQ
jgi:hypothetical protein